MPARRSSSRTAHRPQLLLKSLLSTFLALALVVSLHGEAAATPRQGSPDDEKWTPRKEKSVPGVRASVKPKTTDPSQGPPVTTSPAVDWPKPGKAEVAVPAPVAAGVSWDAVLAGKLATQPGPAAKAGTLPVKVGPTSAANRAVTAAEKTAAAATPSKVQVELVGRESDRLLLKLARTDGAKRAGTVSLRVDYSSFAKAYGGDWNTRLHLVKLPACALTTPLAKECNGTPIATRNTGSGELSGDVQAAPTASLYSVQAAASGPAGDLTATSLSPAASWQAGGSSGDFSWSYPMETPPSLGGPNPELALAYSSGGVDGRTTTSNNQPSWIGEGFEFGPGGSIERRYAACSSKNEESGNNGRTPVGDMCWGTDNAYLTLDGKGGELVLDDKTNTWHPRLDDGTKVERKYGADNGDTGPAASVPGGAGEYWVITGKDGTKYYFGLNKLPGATAEEQKTKSTWTVPIFGNHGHEPCNASTFAASHCQQAYKWNLDYVVDTHGNTMSLFYDTEINNYARNNVATAVSSYTRAGNLKRIEYGQRDGQVFGKPAVARIQFATAPRCVLGTACGPSDYPDTPLDQECTSTTNCKDKYNPTFWTKLRLAKVTTEVWHGTRFDPVDSWTLRQSFPDPGDGTRPGLWLEGITNSGHVGGSVSTPEVGFSRIMLPNRVVGADGLPAMNWGRISAVHYGTGGEISVKYTPQDCSLPNNVPAPDTNGKRCHPVKWTPQNQAERQDWFHKYSVIGVTESDRTTGLAPVESKFEYLSPPAWRHDDEDGLVEIGRKSWSQWRGYEKVKVVKGSATGPQSVSINTYFRGMDGDKKADGTLKDVHVPDSTGATVEDINPLAGELREQTSYDGTKIVSRSISDHWVSAPLATRVKPWGTMQTFNVQDSGMRQDEALETGYRQNVSKATFAANGKLVASQDLGDIAKPSDDVCTRYEYAENPAQTLLELKAREHKVKVACDKAWTKDDVLSDERIFYDNSTTVGAPPTKGDTTRVERLSGFDSAGQPTYEKVLTAAYDEVGRETQVVDALNRTTSISYFPADGALTKTVVDQPGGHQKITELEPAWGEELAITDADNRRSELQYDPMGRTAKVWLPGRAGAAIPNMEYSYGLRDDGANVVTTKTLQADGGVETEYELTDGLLRPRQKQEAAPGGGRIVTDYIHDSRGNLVKENGPYYNDAPPGTDVLLPVEAELPAQKLIEYNASDEPTVERQLTENKEKWRTTYQHAADRHTTQPPAGEQPVTRINDALGRLVELREYAGGTATGTYDSTTYTYHPAGQLATVKDPAGNQWKFDYDVRGRKVREEDPDKGVTTYEYDAGDQAISSTDARGVKLVYSYDAQGRRTGMFEGSLQGTKRAEWTYDSLSKGDPTSSTRYVNGHAYTTKVSGYDVGGRPTGMQFTIPSAEGQLADTYTFASTYNEDGELASSKLPGVGGLPEETLTYGYNELDLPTTLKGATTYVSGTTYTPFGEPDVVTLGGGGASKYVQRKHEYELGTRRLKRVVTEKELLPRRVSSVSYEYDPAGNVTKIADAPSTTTGEPTDTQCFKYDNQRRMTSAWTPASNDCAATPTASALGGPAPYWHSWTFDKTGNRKSETRTTAGGSATSTYEYPAAGLPQPHAVQKVTTGGTSNTYQYDKSGNLENRTVAGTGESFTFDAEGHLEKVVKAGKTTSFVYDADGTRLLRRDPSGTTLYLGETELHLTGSTVVGTRYYQHGGKTVAVRTGGKVSWLGTDHHGTPDLAIDAETQTVQRRRTTPYGEARGAAPTAWPGERSFVGGTSDPSTGLVHLGAREYDPTIGRFISVDPVADYENPQQLNGYAYANNNPATYEDADGRLFWFAAILAIRLIPVIIRVMQVAPVVIKTVTPVIVPMVVAAPKVVNAIQRIAPPVIRNVVKLIPKLKTVLKPIARNVRKLISKPVRNTKRQQVKQAPKKPPAKAKTPAKKDLRNTTTPKKPGPQGKPTAQELKDKNPAHHSPGKAPVQFKYRKPSPKESMQSREGRKENHWAKLGEEVMNKPRLTNRVGETVQDVAKYQANFAYDHHNFATLSVRGGIGVKAVWSLAVLEGTVGVVKFFEKLGKLLGITFP